MVSNEVGVVVVIHHFAGRDLRPTRPSPARRCAATVPRPDGRCIRSPGRAVELLDDTGLVANPAWLPIALGITGIALAIIARTVERLLRPDGVRR